MIAGTGAGAALVLIALVALAVMSIVSSFDRPNRDGGSPNN